MFISKLCQLLIILIIIIVIIKTIIIIIIIIIIKIKHLDMEDRDPLPKITKDKNAKKLIRTGNQIIANIIDNCKETLNITSINQ